MADRLNSLRRVNIARWPAITRRLSIARGLAAALAVLSLGLAFPAAPVTGAEEADPARLRIETRREGIHRITWADLQRSGVEDAIDPRTLQLFNRGREAAIHVLSAGDVFSPGDAVVFFAEAVDTSLTGTNVYWLAWNAARGKRMAAMPGSPAVGATAGKRHPVDRFYHTLRVEENNEIWLSTPGAPEEDYWFWKRMTGPDKAVCPVRVPSPVPDAPDARVRACFQGRSAGTPRPNHHTVIELNGTEIGASRWHGQEAHVQEARVTADQLSDGANTCTVRLPGDTGATVDAVYLNWIEIGYWRTLQAEDDRLAFGLSGARATDRDGDGATDSAGTGDRTVAVTGFTGPDPAVYDVTDPVNVKRITGCSVEPHGRGYRLTFDDSTGGERRFWAGTIGAYEAPAAMELRRPQDLRSTQNGADWIVITPRAFLPAAAPLASWRRAQGYRAVAVAVEDVYDVFSHGLFDPAAIKEFLRYASDNWAKPAPAFVLLAGDATYDYRGYLATGKTNGVPARLVNDGSLIPSDNWYACLDGPGDVVPDLHLGRIPGADARAIARQVEKIIDYERSPWPAGAGVLLVSDDKDASFEAVTEAAAAALPAQVGVDRVYLGNCADAQAARRGIIDSLNQGALVTAYAGHGSVRTWAGEKIFQSSDVPALNNRDRLTLVVALTCLNGYFCEPNFYSVAEALMAHGDGGAIGVFAPSGMAGYRAHRLLGSHLFAALFQGTESLLGPAVDQAREAAYKKGISNEVMRMYNLFGDPATRLKTGPDDRAGRDREIYEDKQQYKEYGAQVNGRR